MVYVVLWVNWDFGVRYNVLPVKFDVNGTALLLLFLNSMNIVPFLTGSLKVNFIILDVEMLTALFAGFTDVIIGWCVSFIGAAATLPIPFEKTTTKPIKTNAKNIILIPNLPELSIEDIFFNNIIPSPP